MNNTLLKLITLLLIVFAGQSIIAQSFINYKHLINPDQEQTLLPWQEQGFEIISAEDVEGCKVKKLKKQKTTFIYRVCEDEEGVWFDFVLIERDLETIVNLLNIAKADSSLSVYNTTITSNSAIIFIEDGLKEIFFVLDHKLGFYTLSGSNSAQFDYMKENIERNRNFDPKKDIVSLLRSMIDLENKNGESMQSVLNDFELSTDFDLLDMPSVFAFIEDFENSKTHNKFKQIIDLKFLNDETYIAKVYESLNQMEIAGTNSEIFYDNLEEVLLKIAIENNQMKSFLMFSYVSEEVKKKGRLNAVSPECEIGMFAIETLVKLKPKQVNKIIENDTLYFENDILLTSSMFVCPEGRKEKMKVLRNLKEATALLIPLSSEYKYDSLLFINTHFFRSNLNSGLIISSLKDKGNTQYDYPEDKSLYALTTELEKEGLYKLKNGAFVFMTASMSQDSYNEYCTNETCYIPYPGILYDKKINLNQLKSLDGLGR